MYQITSSELSALSLQPQHFQNKKVLLRTCLNLSQDEQGAIVDRSRYDESLPLIQELASQARAVLITAHFWRPKGPTPTLSFAPVAQKLAQDLGQEVHFLSTLEDLNTQYSLNPNASGVFFLENIRFRAGEESKDAAERMAFAQTLAQGSDLFVNDAFADYRESASTYDVATLLPSFLGPVFFREVAAICALANCQRPFVAVIGGAKLSEKLDTLLSLLKKADYVLIGWAMAYTLLASQGQSIGKSLVESDKLDVAKQIMVNYANKLILPLDHAVVTAFADPGASVPFVDQIQDGQIAVDIGPKTITRYLELIAQAKTLVRNGPMGVTERAATRVGSEAIARAMASSDAYSVVGGGDSITAINAIGVTGFDHISTGGGALLALLGYEVFPTLDVIRNPLV